MTDYMDEAELLVDTYASAIYFQGEREVSGARAALLSHIQRGVPEGWQVVPKVPTPEMKAAPTNARPGFSDLVAREVYSAMLAAAPAPDHFRDAAEMAHDQFRGVTKMIPEQACDRIAVAIHYPECLDTAAYPTVESALSEVFAHYRCTEHDAPAEVPMPFNTGFYTVVAEKPLLPHGQPRWKNMYRIVSAETGQVLGYMTDPAMLHNYGDAREAAGYARGLAEGVARTGLTPAEHDVLAERERQISAEGWTPDHDDEHDKRELSRASLCYVQQYVGRFWLVEDYEDGLSRYQSDEAPDEWPWDEDWWKPTAPRRDLVKAAALLLAEIERLDRAALRGEVK